MSFAGHRELTDLEQRVARLVAWGGSNRDVAEALGIDAKEVERTLRQVYRKLGIRARAGRGTGRAALGSERMEVIK